MRFFCFITKRFLSYLIMFMSISSVLSAESFDFFCASNMNRTGNSLNEIFESVGFQKVVKTPLPLRISEEYYTYPTDLHDVNRMRSFGVISTPLERLNGGHEGVDISGKLGAPVYAINQGEIVYTLTTCKSYSDKWCGNGWGNHIVIKHPNNFYSRYAHLDKVLVKIGEEVTEGQNIGKLGSSGLSDGPHLHFEIGIKKDGFKDCITPQNFDYVLDPKKLY
jgi:murein DD-endopeptidase MepM/ murein hydrolase activator NlpD